MSQRAAKMFTVGAPAPVESGMGPAAGGATNRLVQLASKVVSAWSKPQVDELSSSFGNFDRVVCVPGLVGVALTRTRL